MKKLVTLLALFMLFSVLSLGQSIKHVSLSFNKNEFKLQQDEQGHIVISSTVYSYHLKSDTLLPALPYIGFNVLVKNNESYVGFTSSCSKTIIQNNVMVTPNPIAIPTNLPPLVSGKNGSFIYNQQIYPEVYVEYAGSDESNGYKILTFLVCPFEYDATTKKLSLRSTINLDIHLNILSQSTQSKCSSTKNDNMNKVIQQIIVNPEDFNEQSNSITRTDSNLNLAKQTGYEYVIVTSNLLKDCFQELAAWKNRKGIRSKVVTVEEIDSTFSGATKQEKIKRALANIEGLSYVLLGGDTVNVPTCMCYIGQYLNTDSITPADSYYACLGTMNWDRNGNGFYGEFDDSVSLIPSLNVSRAPVYTVTGAQSFVSRIINYESAPDTTNWQDNILMSGTSLGKRDSSGVLQPFYDPLSGLSDTQIWSQMMYDEYIAPSGTYPSWNGVRTRFYDTYTDISGDDTYDFNASNLQNELKKGYTFVDVMTHGSQTGWKMEGDNDSYNWNYSSVLRNTGYTIIITTACLTNAFDFHAAHRCLSVDFMIRRTGGILAYWGTSRENWHYLNLNYLGTGAEYNGFTYRKLFEDKYHRMGKATTAVKIEKMSLAMDDSEGYEVDRKVWMGLNLMGDPEMPVYLNKPKYFQNVSVQVVNDSIYVNAGTGDFDICFINQDDSTDYYIARDVSDSIAVFNRLNGVFDVCITKPGYVPYFIVCGDTYLQNISLSGAKYYVSKKAMIGSNVTDKVEQGPVLINNGSTTIKAEQDVTITKDFEVRQGAIFTITQ